MDQILQALKTSAGIHIMSDANARFQRSDMALDAQPQLVTTSNSGIPAFLSTFIDPKMIEVLVAPMKAAQIVGDELQKGDWTTKTSMFPVVESTGEVSSYGDYSENGVANANVNWVNRQSYQYQLFTQWGEMELETAGLGRIDWANRLGIASVTTLNLFQNYSYFFGIKGLENYGLLNDPALPAAIAPVVGNWASSGTAATDVLSDIAALFAQLQTQANGLVDLETPMTLAMSPIAQAQGLTKTTQYNVNVMDLLKKNYPNMKIETAPQYNTASGELLQLIVTEVQGQRTASCAFTEKLRAHPIIVAPSSFKQKKSQGTWGTVIYRPFLIAQMLGVA